MNPTREQALENLWMAARQARLTFDEHTLVQRSYETLKGTLGNNGMNLDISDAEPERKIVSAER